jgi:hypothetical protein
MFAVRRQCVGRIKWVTKLTSGNLVGNVSQRLLSKYIFKAAEKEEVKPELFDKIFEHELDVINKFNEPRDERDAQCRIEMIPSCKASIEQTLKLVKEVFKDEALTSERYVQRYTARINLGYTWKDRF